MNKTDGTKVKQIMTLLAGLSVVLFIVIKILKDGLFYNF